MRARVVLIAATAVLVVAAGALWLATDDPVVVVAPVIAIPSQERHETSLPPSIAATREETPTRVAAQLHANHFSSGADLWETFQTLRRSTDSGELRLAEKILSDCVSDTQTHATGVRILAGEGVTIIDDETIEEMREIGRMKTHREKASEQQVAAAREIAARCARFAPMTSEEYAAQIDEVRGRRQNAVDPVAVAEAIRADRLPATDDRLKAVLDSRDPAAIKLIDGELLERSERVAARPPGADAWTPDIHGLTLALCDLGEDCSRTSERALVRCMHVADLCGMDVGSQALALETAAARQIIEARRRQILEAIMHRDYRMWGL